MSELTRMFVKFSFVVNVVFNMLARFLSRTVVPREKKTVIIEQGILQGKHYTTLLSNKPYVSFLGIPYAKPPVGDLRFMPPVKHPGWSGVLKAFSEGDKCMQIDIFTNRIVGSEDCLYLNVLVPQEELNEKKAVMVFIHGGAFNFGSGTLDKYSPDYLLDENVIVVIINYRLNVLGFLNFDIDECPGNMGLKDQLFALKWTKANISAFGGDVDNITIFGESAGSASVHCHILSPQSTGLFQKAIMQSGCMFNTWAFNKNHRKASFKFVNKLGCQMKNPREIIQYLKTLPAIQLVKFSKFKNNLDFPFIPSVENDAVSERFLTSSPENLLRAASLVPIITGVNNMEGLIVFDENEMEALNNFPHKTEKISKFFKGQYSEEVINKIKHFYFNEHNLECQITKMENICHFYSDVFFIKDFDRGFHNFLENEVSPVYVYEFKFDGEINTLKNLIFLTRPKLRNSLKGACHADELSYLFYGQLFGFCPKVNSPEFRMCKTMSRLWSNFAKTGNPNSSDLSFKWNTTSLCDPKYLSIDGDNTRMTDGLLYGSRVKLWENIRNCSIKT